MADGAMDWLRLIYGQLSVILILSFHAGAPRLLFKCAFLGKINMVRLRLVYGQFPAVLILSFHAGAPRLLFKCASLGKILTIYPVLFRMNFMAVTLCFCMNRPYQFYYFVPLVSFWFSMLYLVLLTPPRVTAQTCETNPLHYLYLAIKIIIFFSFIVILYMSEVFFEKVFVTRPWKALFVTTDDDIHEWWFRWKLDRYSTAYGAVFALALMVAQRYNLVDDNNHSNLFSPRIAICLALTGLAGIIANTIFTLLCSNKPECNEVHSYTVFVPIISYIALRNLSGILRTRYSSLFAWFGRISLELFIGQYHIWLAADSYGVLVIIPRYPVLNSLVTFFIFVCASHEIHLITMKLLPFAVPYDWRLAVRNIIIFLCILMPIGIYDGMF